MIICDDNDVCADHRRRAVVRTRAVDAVVGCGDRGGRAGGRMTVAAESLRPPSAARVRYFRHRRRVPDLREYQTRYNRVDMIIL